MFTCYKCSREIKNPDEVNRYCPYCGTCYVMSCSSVICQEHGELVIRGRDAFCRYCGSLYRYTLDNNRAVRVSPEGPWYDSASQTLIPLVDLYPAEADPFYSRMRPSLVAAKREPEVQSETWKPCDGAPIAAFAARHQRIYTLSATTGGIFAHDIETLTPSRRWVAPPRDPAWQRNEPDVQMKVGESLLVVGVQNTLHGFDTGTGRSLFTLTVDGGKLQEFQMVHGWLLALTVSNTGEETILLYSLAELCQKAVTPIKSLDLPGPEKNGPRHNLKQRIMPQDTGAYLLCRNGQVWWLPFADETHTVTYANNNQVGIMGWSANVTAGVILTTSQKEGVPCELITFNSGETKAAGTPTRIKEFSPHPLLSRLHLWEKQLILPDREGRIIRLSLDAPAEMPEIKNPLSGLSIVGMYPSLLMPFNRQKILLVHITDQDRHRLRWINLDQQQDRLGHDIPQRPEAENIVQATFCGQWLIVGNLTTGQMKLWPLASLPKEGLGH